MRIDEIYARVCNDLRKPVNGSYAILQFNGDAKRAQLEAFTEYLSGYSETQKLHDALSPFKAPLLFTPTTSVNGSVAIPPDYAHLLAADGLLFDNVTGKKRGSIRFVNENELSSALESQVRKVTLNSPAAVGNATTIQLYPEVAQTGQLQYLRLPKDPKYAYSQSGRTLTYDSVNSVQIEFTDVYINNIIAKIVAYAAQYLDDAPTQQFSQLQQAQNA